MFINTGASTIVPSELVELEYIKPNSTETEPVELEVQDL